MSSAWPPQENPADNDDRPKSTEARRVLLIRDECFYWAVARAALDVLPAVTVVGEANAFGDAYHLALRLQPDAILSVPRVDDEPVLPFLARLRRHLPRATFAVIADDFAAADLLTMEDIGVSGWLLWPGLSDALLPHILAAATDAHTVVLHEAVAHTLLTAERQRLTRREPAPPLSARERAILRGLAEALIVSEIAVLVGVTERTVKRDIAKLETKLGAPDRFVLGVKAARMALVP
jgi:DNA-binding NarL/FixJ family response regulator